jgi:O-antigen/teichoic acid export membrane protein
MTLASLNDRASATSKRPVQLRAWHIARSILSNWLATAATLAVGFFLAPFVVHRLGNIAYGVWVLAISAVNYLALLDLGLAGSIVRYVSKGYATNNHDEASEVFSGIAWVRFQISALVLLLSGCLSVLFPYFFRVPASLAREAQEAVLIVGLANAVYMAVGMYSSVLSALNRYDLRACITLFQLTVRVVGVVLVLRAGYGIVAVASCELLAATVGNGLLMLAARRVYPKLTLRLVKPRRETLRKVWSYSMYAFLLTIAGQFIYQTDNLVVGAFVSASAVTFYSIGNSLCRYTQQLIYSMTSTFNPAASTYESAGDTTRLQALYYNGTRGALVIALPIVITFLVRGESFIAVWMGPQYSQTSGTVLAILAVALLFTLSNSTAAAIAWGVEKHKTVAMWAVPEAIANFTLSIVLAHKIGIYGVAIGTLVPSLVIQLILWPRYVSRLVDVTWTQVYQKVWGPVYLAAAPFALASYATEIFFSTRTMALFVIQTLALLPIFGVALAIVFRNLLKRRVVPHIRSYFFREQAG